ncbi:MAG: FG-GAP repeat domain-containing protein, partial [Thermoanaerobaculia bacterium]
LVGGYASNHVFPIRLDGDRVPSLVMGSIFLGATYLPWRNDGKGNFKGFSFDAMEPSAYHLGIAAGNFGKEKLPAFADLFFRRELGSPRLAAGVTLYVDRSGAWEKIPVWREKGYKSSHLVSVAMGDLDGDGLDDVVFPDFVAKKLRIFYQTTDGKFLESPENLEPDLRSAVCDVRLADLNGDGRLDVVLAETTYTERPEDRGGFEVFLNQGK